MGILHKLAFIFELFSTTEFGGKRIFHPQFTSRKEEVKVIEKFLNLGTMKGVLDYGCGQSPYRTLLPINWIGADVIEKNNVDITVHENEFPKNLSYSHFLCTSVLEHVENLDEFLENFNNQVPSGTLCLFTVPFLVHEHGTPNDFRRFTVNGLKKIFTEHEILSAQKLYGAGFCIANLINNQIDTFIRSSNFFRKIYIVSLPLLLLMYSTSNILGIIADNIMGEKKSNFIYNSSAILFRKK